MKFNIDRPPKYIRQENKRKELREWHSKFAWWPTIVDETDGGYGRVLFEHYMRRQRVGPTATPAHSNGYFVKYSMKEYFKKKLNGDFEMDRESWDERSKPDTDMGTTSTRGILKKGGPHTNTNIKRHITGYLNKNIGPYDKNKKEIEE